VAPLHSIDYERAFDPSGRPKGGVVVPQSFPKYCNPASYAVGNFSSSNPIIVANVIAWKQNKFG
jgi:hypothetical protein